MNRDLLLRTIETALQEDLGTGDITTESVLEGTERVRARFCAREKGVLAGLDVARLTFETLDPGLRFEPLSGEGDDIQAGEPLAEIEGPAAPILSAERVALNFLQRLSGIATRTREHVNLVAGYEVRLTDTRKTTPGLRILEKYAVRIGGAFNHRMGLYDAVLIKDNHIRAAGGIKRAVAAARERIPHTMKIEVETENLQQVREALDVGVDTLLLDNMCTETMEKAVILREGRSKPVLLEASGGITRDNLVEVARTGVDIISLGTLTHSARALDIGLDFEEEEWGP